VFDGGGLYLLVHPNGNRHWETGLCRTASKHDHTAITVVQFPKSGLVRLRAILAPAGPIPVSKSTW
jgi:hypothetical protein